jgi:hypothetical protein
MFKVVTLVALLCLITLAFGSLSDDLAKMVFQDDDDDVPACPPGHYYSYYEQYCVKRIKRVAKKPVLYLYHPTNNSSIQVTIPVGKGEKITTHYPAFNVKGQNSWKVNSFGERVTIGNRKYQYLFWEKNIDKKSQVKSIKFEHSFKGSDSEAFLEKATIKLGLNERERTDFITFWLPQLQRNAANEVYFDTDISGVKRAVITPKPKTHIYVMMYFRKINKLRLITRTNFNKTLDKIKAVPRSSSDFVAVEWGGVNLDEK